MKEVIGLFLVFVAFANASGQAKQPLPIIAYSSGNSVVLTARDGKPVKTIKLSVPVGEFSIAPDQKSIAIISPHEGKYGGKMYLFTVATGKLVALPPQTMNKEADSAEVYSEPQFSPDGSKLIVVTHAQAEGDIIDGAGPLVIVDLKTLHSKPMPPTLTIDGGSDLLSHPRWAPNGHHVLVNIENALAVIDVQTNSIRRLDHEVSNNLLDWAMGIGWLGTNCVFYQSGSEPTFTHSAFFVLNLKTGEHFPAEKILGHSDDELRGLISFSFPYGVVKQKGHFILTNISGTEPLSLPTSAGVQLIPQADGATLPDACK